MLLRFAMPGLVDLISFQLKHHLSKPISTFLYIMSHILKKKEDKKGWMKLRGDYF